MVFSSLVFLCIFLPTVFLLYTLVPSLKFRNGLLIVASLIFYAYGEPVYVLLMIFSSLLNYICARLVANENAKRKLVLVLAVVINLGILAVFKYSGFFVESLNSVTGLAIPVPQIDLPIGISFFTFQALSYVIDVYRKTVDAQKNYLYVLLYITFFPQLIAGPIVKYRDISEQIVDREQTAEKIADGMRRFICGLAKKVLIANTMGQTADIIFNAGNDYLSVVTAWLGALAYLFQIYYDFSGYSDMAIGLGKMFGFDFKENFNYPYGAVSVKDFWRKWHISLSTWFKEYLYIPLGGNRKGLKRQIFNLFVVELLTGIWHGANWNFICWGLYYFVLLALEKLFLLPYLKKGRVWPHIYTLFLVVVGWAMFVGNDAGVEFGLLFRKLFIPSGGVMPLYFLRNYGVLLAVSVVCCTPLIEKLWKLLSRNAITKALTILVLLTVSMAYVVGSTNSPFLYFNF